jgi:urease accessory protein
MSVNEALASSSWRAELTLQYKRQAGKTVIASRRHTGPLVVQKPFYPEAEVCHTYILHPPGGVVGGDQLTINLDVERGAHALVTTPASGKFYRCDHRQAIQCQNLKVEDGGILEWLPQETILFDQAKVKTQTLIELDNQAKFVGWEIMCLGRPASDERYSQGYCHQNYEISRHGKKILVERAMLNGGSELLDAKWGMQAYSVTGLMVVSNANNEMLNMAREAEPVKSGLVSATLIGDLLICRCLGDQGIEVREFFTRIWEAIRPEWVGRKAVQPRIWNT